MDKSSLAALKAVKNLPAYYTNPSEVMSKKYKFYKTKLGHNNGKGIYLEVVYPIEHWGTHIPFREKHNLETVGDICRMLNEFGFQDTIRGRVHDVFGIRFNTEDWVWYCDVLAEDVPLTNISVEGGAQITSGLLPIESDVNLDYQFSSYDRYSCLYIIACTSSQNLDIGLPKWLTIVNGYKYTPDKLEFVSTDRENHTLYLGMEIEVSSKLCPAELQYVVTKMEPVQQPFFYHKHDGSIKQRKGFPNNFEIVTFPMTYKALKQNMTTLFDKLKTLGDVTTMFATGDDTGIHIHVNRGSFFSKLHRNKFSMVFNQFNSTGQEFIQRIAKRKFNAYCMPYEQHYGRSVAYRLENGPYAPGHNNSRRAACRETNMTNEVRIFKGGFDLDHIKYCLEVVHAFHQYTDKTPVSVIGSWRMQRDFEMWLSTEQRYKRLKKELNLCA